MKKTPLILVFYIFNETMGNPDIIGPFMDSIKVYIESKDYEIMSLFLPTDTEERVECINPVIATKEQIEKINSLISDIEDKFEIGIDDNIDDESINDENKIENE